MRKLLLTLSLLLAPLTVSAQGIPTIQSNRTFSPRAAARYVEVYVPRATLSNGLTMVAFVYPHAAGARLVDFIVHQATAGTSGTNWTLNVRNAAGTSLLTTQASIPIGAGANATTDAKGELAGARCSGCTRPVLKTDTTVVVQKGDLIEVVAATAGAYSPFPTGYAVLVFEPLE